MYLYKYRSLQTLLDWERLGDILENDRLYFPTYDQLNDPYEGASTLLVPKDGYAGCSLSNEYDMDYSVIASIKKQYRLLSLSGTCKSTLLWAHYAGYYTGLVLVYKSDKSFASAQKVIYQNAETREQIKVSAEECDKEVCNTFLSKYKDWEYEHEWRIIEKTDDKYFNYNSNELVGIIVGNKFSNYSILMLKGLLDKFKNGLSIYRAIPGFQTNGIRIIKLVDVERSIFENELDFTEEFN